MWHKAIKLKILTCLVFLPIFALSTLSLYGCNSNKTQVVEPEPHLPQMPKNVSIKVELSDLEFNDLNVSEINYKEVKFLAKDYIHKLINRRNNFVNGNLINLTENENYLITGLEDERLKSFVDRKLNEQTTLTVRVRAQKNDAWLTGQTSFQIINRSSLNKHYNLGKVEFNDIVLSRGKLHLVNDELKQKINKQLSEHFGDFKQTSENQGWTISDYEGVVRELTNGYQFGTSVDVAVKPNHDDSPFINSAWVKVSNCRPMMVYVTDLIHNYNQRQCISALNHTAAALRQLRNEELLEEIDKIFEQLKNINRKTIIIYEQLAWILGENGLFVDRKFTELDFKKIYKLLVENTNQKFFYWTYEQWIEFISPREEKNEPEWLVATLNMIRVFAIFQSLYPVSQLLIMCDYFFQKNYALFDENNTESLQMLERIGNSLFGLRCWCQSAFVEAQTSPTTKLKIITFDVFRQKREWFMEQFYLRNDQKLEFKNYVISNDEIDDPRRHFYRNQFPLPFVILENKPTIEVQQAVK